ncbi:AAA family ATPase [Gordonia sp. NPDC003504]
MRIHHLRMRAFGPFADETVIDVDALAADGLFLLHGQTGAGKSTILDAVAFALFGRVPGARNDAKRLHSDHAAPDVVPEVELEATIGGRRLRIIRSPEFHRPKKTGEGTRKINARASLVWVDGSGPALTRIPDIGDAVIGVLGMSAEQFFQVVLLPQGDFARFLRANPDERETLLERVFDTARFGDLEEWLRERARESEADLGERTAALDRLAGQIVAVGGGDAPAEPDDEWAQACLEAAAQDDSRSATVLTAAQAAADQARAAYDAGVRIADLRRRGGEARSQLGQLARGEAEFSAANTALAAARRAAPLGPIADDLDRAITRRRQADRGVDRAAGRFVELDEAAAWCAGREANSIDPDALEEAIGRWTAESGRWQPLARRIGERPGLIADIDAVDTRITQCGKRMGELSELLEHAPERRRRAANSLTAATAVRVQVPGLRTEHERLTKLVMAWEEREKQRASARTAERTLLDAREKQVSAAEHLVDLRRRRLDGMAAELAAQLVDGQPCTVCGSADHPEPTVAIDGTSVSDADEADARAAEQDAATHRDAAQVRHAAIAQRLAVLDDTLGEMSRGQIDDDLARSVAALADADRSLARIPELEHALDAIEAETDAWRRELGECESTRSADRQKATSLRETLTALDAEVLEATGGRGGITERLAELDELIRRATSLRDARRVGIDAAGRHDDIAQRLGERCVAAGFEDAAAMRAALATDDQITQWEMLLTRAGALRAAAEATLAEPDVAAALTADSVDVDALSADLRVAEEVREAAAREHAVATRRHTILKEYVAQFWSAADGLAPLRERHEELRGLAELVAGRGQNSRRMALRSYVLAARLEEVLVAASARLRQMSSGRYEFAHSDAAGPRGRRGGLGIEVRDEYTGAVRATTTLSGGETFFASLALALGLADVVSAEAGGRVLDTLFIDEGFGTLDPEALDLVMGVLDELRSGGRVVGVVSHVEELRARIPVQLHVIRGENGSRVRMEGMAVPAVGG